MKTTKKFFMPLNLQFFAEDGGDDNPGDHTPPEFNVDELNLSLIHI